ncbi:MAG: ATP-binding cassette domain-containing protein [Atribacterota bacterium]|jgi:ABC-type branched-subunit amino acid transport system ATPase component|uniref:High-affinity branched-chain amino acid transport ATP-binding protein LivF n=1 Tax=Atribacter laminatus TaxID=2847778 RepID=A0A7T1F2L5_ATRLM|nr:ATP-binding cassette domain-containing protein [Atribacter laminatus]MDI9595361.1 ATP-binding cassette domain-containing protein [Atribacterota bacterium]QPM67435.1 High-affinity branched-chain amino acid transport ATP-binding protein LivF [Atribacter laminatus]
MLKVADIDVAYGHAKVLYNIFLELEAGKTVFIVGRNGAGKTTLLKSIVGLIRPIKGSIYYDNENITGLLPNKLYHRGIRYVNQDKKVFGSLTVQENIELAAFSSGEPLSRALNKVLEIYPKMKEFLQLKAGQLSGGQRQVLLIGQALVGDPRLMLIDEPTQGLAAVVINDIAKILSRLRGKLTTIIVEQNLPLVSRLADQVIVLKEGKVSRILNDVSEIRNIALLEKSL